MLRQLHPGLLLYSLLFSALFSCTPEQIAVRARVTMLCGCATEPGGHWDSTAYTIEARIVEDDKVLETAILVYAGEPSVYAGRITVPVEDGLTLQVLAMDPSTGNFGMVEKPFDESGAGQSSE